jgi:hypothetical protein
MGHISATSLLAASVRAKTGSPARQRMLDLKMRIGKSVLGQHTWSRVCWWAYWRTATC